VDRRQGNAVRKKEVEDMATGMHRLASMTPVVEESPDVRGASKQEKTDDPVDPNVKLAISHRTATAVGFLAFLGLWYAFSPYLPQAVKQFLWAVQH
jgi:hypothetical protein